MLRFHSPKSTAFVGVCIFFFDNTTTIAEFAMRVMKIKIGAIIPVKWEEHTKETLH
jgi:hypothetical protein